MWESIWHVLAKYPFATVSSLGFYALMIAAFVPGLRERIVPRFSHPISPEQSFLSSMDALRGFAAAYVALGHCWHWTYPVFYKSQVDLPPLAYGAKAVPMFALLSGFLIYRSVRKIETREDVRYYIARRFWRIYPLYLLSVILCLVFGQIVSDYEGVGTLSYFIAELMMFRSLGFLQFANPVTWSLYVEVVFYVFLPIYVMFVGLKRILPVSIFVLVMLILADQVPGREFQLWKYFFMGMIASELGLRYQEQLRGPLGKVILAVGAVLLIADLAGPRFDWVAHAGLVKRNLAEYTIGLGISFAMIAMAISYVPLAGRLLDAFPIRFIGVVSYSVFIIHPFYLLINFPELVLRKAGSMPDYWTSFEVMPSWYLPVLFAPGIFAWAAVTFVLIERPALVAGSSLIRRARAAAAGGISQAPSLSLPLPVVLARAGLAALAVLGTLYMLRSAPNPATASETVAGPTRCEIELGPERCPGLPTFEPAKTSRVFADDWKGSGASMPICMKRAPEFYSSCQSKTPVTARFYAGDKLVRAVTWH